jgi:two-component system sensor histidine kinase KdpD
MADGPHDPAQRPSPEALLRMAHREEGRLGKLRIFVGAAPGVGKTYQMLETARARKNDGYDIVVAVVGTHRPKEKHARLEGREARPPPRVA